MNRLTTARRLFVPAFLLVAGLAVAGICLAHEPASSNTPDDKSEVKKATRKSSKPRKKDTKIRWGKRRTETDAEYDNRYGRLLKKIKQDKRGDFNGGHFENERGEKIRLWTYMGHPFIVRSDIDAQFTADTAMYMEMLHREYGEAYRKLLGIPADVREKIEVIVFSDRSTYMKNGGTPGSGGFFHPAVHLLGDRGPFWKARRYRLQQFTNGITDFSKWEKGTLKHEAAHMELQLRLGNTLYANAIGFPVDCPRWWNEGHAAVFEYWDFDKTVDENFSEVPRRGRYAPFIRRLHGTDAWKDFNYVWTIDPQTWHRDMTTPQGYLNYCQAWSLAAYMMSGSQKGKDDFRKIFNLSKRVGSDRQTTYHGDRTIAWTTEFPEEDKGIMEKNWNEWVQKMVPRKKKVPDEEYFLMRAGYNPEILDRLERFTSDEMEKLKEKIDEEEAKRQDPNRIEK